ncbi:OsmC family protein [Enterobacter mori]|uniref:OsmC family protein n=1 Tax=Enterobacter mori TaxID=539813 RepID=UPI00402AC280
MNVGNKPVVDLAANAQAVEAVRANPDLANVRITMNSKSSGGLRTIVNTGSIIQGGTADASRKDKFSLMVDEPVSMLGTDLGANPVEYVLTGLAGCNTIVLANLAAAAGIVLDSINIELSFDININGLMGIDPAVRKGAQAINMDFHVESPNATREQLQTLIGQLSNESPVYDTLANAVNVSARLI